MKKSYLFLFAFLFIGILSTNAQFTVLYNFSGTAGDNPAGPLTQCGPRLFGVQPQGLIYPNGCLFSINLDGSDYKDIHDFNQTSGGYSPTGALAVKNGVLYGMCCYGGANSEGTIFSIDTNGSAYTDMYDFTTTNGKPYSQNSLTLEGNMLFGLEGRGGAYTQGFVFSIQTNGHGFKDLYDFGVATYDGSYPYGYVTVSGNVMYGFTYNGGQNFDGTVWSMDTSGASYKKLYDMVYPTSTEPLNGAPLLSGNTLYCLSEDGGTSNEGTLFSLQTNGSGYTLLHSFDSATGYWPYASLTMANGKLWGLTYQGGANNYGVLFSIDTLGATYTDLVNFNNGANGEFPYSSLLLSGGSLYGTTSGAGANGWGTLFKYFDGVCNLNATIATTNLTCFGANNGIETANATGGTTPYTYTWSTGKTTSSITGLVVGLYSVVVQDANGCSFSTGYSNVNQPPLLQDSISESPKIYCNGGTTTLTAYGYGGTPVYTYLWTPVGATTAALTGISSGTYTLTVTDGNGCTATTVFNATTPTKLRDSISSVTNVSCHGGTGSATVGAKYGTTPYTYFWSTVGRTTATATGLSAGSYTVTVTDDHGCTATASVNITQPATLIATAAVGSEVSCNGGNNGSATATQTGGTGPYTYSWSPAGGTNSTATGLTAGNYTVTVTDHNGCTATVPVTITQPFVLNVSAISFVTNVLCFGVNTGKDSAIVAGGTSPYTYVWSPGGETKQNATGLSAGNYTVTVTDHNGCTATAVGTINQPPQLLISATVTANVSCHGGNNGNINGNPSGGTTPYTFSWAPSGGTNSNASNLTAGTYTVTLKDNNGCIATASATITQPPVLAVTATVTAEVTCNGGNNGSASSTATGGTVPYSYSWSGGGSSSTKTAMTAGTYTITVHDSHGCSATASVTITQPPLLHDTITINSNVSCHGGSNGSATASASGGTSPYTYLWTPTGQTTATATGLSAGTYTNTATDSHGCTATASVTITQPPVLAITATVTANVSCNGGNNGSASSTTTGGTSPYTYLWSPGGGTNSTKTGMTAGTYTVTVTDNHGCTATASTTITQPALLRDSIVTASTVNNKCAGGAIGVAKVGVKGGIVPYTYSWSNGKSAATITGLSNGTYTITVKDNNGCSHAATVTITSPAAIRDSAIMTSPLCFGNSNGDVTIGIKGGTSPYTYAWTPNVSTTATATAISSNSYTVSIDDNNGCTSTVSFTLTQPAVIRDSIISSGVICSGGNNGTATGGVKGGTVPYTYNWSNGKTTVTISGLSAGTYSLTVRDKNGCSGTTATVTIIQSAPIRDSISSSTCVSHKATATVGVKGGTVPYTYLWSPGGHTSATVTGLSNGTYTVNVTDKNGCSATVVKSFLCPGVLTDVDDYSSGSDDVSLYPNPNTGQFTVSGLQSSMIIEMYDYTGRKLSSQTTTDNSQVTINISSQPNGIYLIRILTKEGVLVSQKKIVKTQ